MRTLNSGKNFLVTISLMVTMTLLGFVTRKLFVNEIGVEYLGLNGLLAYTAGCDTGCASGRSRYKNRRRKLCIFLNAFCTCISDVKCRIWRKCCGSDIRERINDE